VIRRVLRPLLVLGGLAALLAAGWALVLGAFASSLVRTVDEGDAPEHPPVEDVELAGCHRTLDGRTIASGSVHNRSSETSDYAIHVFSPTEEVVVHLRRVDPSSTRAWSATSRATTGPIHCSVAPVRRSSQVIDNLCDEFDADPRLEQAATRFGPDGLDAIAMCRDKAITGTSSRRSASAVDGDDGGQGSGVTPAGS
jgi:hypothetical protein